MTQTIRISPELQQRLDTAYDAAHMLGDTSSLDGAEFWEQASRADADLAAVWRQIRQALPAGTEQYIIRALVDAEAYRKDQAAEDLRRVAEYARG